MAAIPRGKKHALKRRGKQSKEMAAKIEAGKEERKVEQRALIQEHLPPLLLTFVVLACSGSTFVFCLRDFFSTGKNIGGSWDEAMLMFTKSTDWFIDAKGWKSTQGGFSAIKEVTTDENNMGGFFVRKLLGGAGAAVQLHKMLPLLFHETGAKWMAGHFRPLLYTATVANLCIAIFYGSYYDDLESAGAWDLPAAMLVALAVETIAILCFLYTSRKTTRCPAVAMPEGKTPSSPCSNIVTRTTLIVTSAIAFVAARDLFLPGTIIGFIPRDDIYLEWTNAFFHSPPLDSPEAIDQGMEAPLYVGDKFVSQLAALNILILCLYKFVSTVIVRYGADGGGVPTSRMIWKCAFLGDIALMVCFRFFAHAAKSASLDLRWHLVMLTYETFIFGLYGFF